MSEEIPILYLLTLKYIKLLSKMIIKLSIYLLTKITIKKISKMIIFCSCLTYLITYQHHSRATTHYYMSKLWLLIRCTLSAPISLLIQPSNDENRRIAQYHCHAQSLDRNLNDTPLDILIFMEILAKYSDVLPKHSFMKSS